MFNLNEDLQAKRNQTIALLELSQADADVFNIFMNALSLPEYRWKSKRTAAIQQKHL